MQTNQLKYSLDQARAFEAELRYLGETIDPETNDNNKFKLRILSLSLTTTIQCLDDIRTRANQLPHSVIVAHSKDWLRGFNDACAYLKQVTSDEIVLNRSDLYAMITTLRELTIEAYGLARTKLEMTQPCFMMMESLLIKCRNYGSMQEPPKAALGEFDNFIHDKYGYCYYSLEPGKNPWIYNLYVENWCRGQGHARRLLTQVIEIIRSNLVHDVDAVNSERRIHVRIDSNLEPHVNPERLAEFYRSLGLVISDNDT